MAHAVRRRARRPTRAAGLAAATSLLLLAVVTGQPAGPAAGTPANAGSPPSGHEASEGLTLTVAKGETARAGPRCPAGAPVRRYDVVALAVDITLNRYLDHDPAGRMYALAGDVTRIRTEEAANAAARAGRGEPAVSLGLQGDAIQPLVLRVRAGECLRIALTDHIPREAASIHVHGGALVTPDGRPAVAANPAATAPAGGHTQYQWWVDPSEPEGTHYFHSHATERAQTDHGLFGTIVVEPAGSTWTDPLGGRPLTTGWSAMVAPPHEAAFREYVIDYHEIGDETYQVLDAHGAFVPQVDPVLGEYRPATRALNYRSEPFMDRLTLQKATFGRFDESVAYSSYSFGDPATPIARAYLGDRVKQRVVHAGGEAFHVHHVHGGSIRWHRLSDTQGSATPLGLVKHPPLLPNGSERVDSQSLGPSETFDTENECGAGGCQQSAGDFLFHCHVAQHYFAGMWGIWRVYNTLQGAGASTDSLPPLLPLPAVSSPAAAVPSDQLPAAVGGAERIEAQLPPQGQRKGYDAAVWDWAVDAGRYVGEPSDTRRWPGAPSGPTTAGRPPILFDPRTGRLAYPMLRPHLGARPPFAPNHGPAPFLDPTANGRPPPPPGTSGPASLCPAGTRPRSFDIDAVPVAVPRNRAQHLVDGQGELFSLQPARSLASAGDSARVPLTIRANAGQDCVDVLFRSELEDNDLNRNFAKVSLHIHMVQFDVQGSDGVDTGFNYEQSVRPFTVEGERLTAPAAGGSDLLTVSDVGRFQAGEVVAVGLERAAAAEVRRILDVRLGSLLLDRPLDGAHGAGETVSTEFLRQRWYPDVQFGTAYFHDHVNALHAWSHGLFGAFISEPPDATWHDPTSGAVIDSGPLADVHTSSKVDLDVSGSFRELVTFLQDDDPINRVGRSSGSALNLRAEPLAGRSADPARQFSSLGTDPETPMVEAYVGDPVLFRTLVAATNDVHTFHVDGHSFRADSFNPAAPMVSTLPVGISERFDLAVPAAGGPSRRPGDYLIADARLFKLQEGSWGILRVIDPDVPSPLQRLPGVRNPPAATGDICPTGAPVRSFSVVAVDQTLPMLGGKGRSFVLASAPPAPGGPQPLVLHVAVGDCIDVALTNRSSEPSVSLHAMGLAYDPLTSGGIAVGRDPVQATGRAGSRHYRFYASPGNGETTALLVDGVNPARTTPLGLYGAVVVGPRRARVTDQASGGDAGTTSATMVDVYPSGGDAYRDVTLFLQDQDAAIGTHRMPYNRTVDGPVGVNYRSAPFTGARPTTGATPVIRAEAGDRIHLHVVVPVSEQAQVFSVEAHDWPSLTGNGRASSVQVGAWQAITLELEAGGADALPGDYEYGSHRQPYREAGMWGRLVVTCGGGLPIRPVATPTAGPCRHRAAAWARPAWAAGSGAIVLAGLALATRRRRQARTRSLPPAIDPATATTSSGE